jgi:hypothetical protein
LSTANPNPNVPSTSITSPDSLMVMKTILERGSGADTQTSSKNELTTAVPDQKVTKEFTTAVSGTKR